MSDDGTIIWTTTRGDVVEVYPSYLETPLADQDRGIYRWRYRVRASNNKVVEQGSEGYTRKGAAIRAAERHHPRVDPQVITDGVADAIEDYVTRRHGVFGAPDAAWLLEFLADNGLTVVQSSARRVDQ